MQKPLPNNSLYKLIYFYILYMNNMNNMSKLKTTTVNGKH